MNIIVCIKQVPDTTEIKLDPVKGTLIRDGVVRLVVAIHSLAEPLMKSAQPLGIAFLEKPQELVASIAPDKSISAVDRKSVV